MKSVLPLIVVSQFFCTSMWFACNAIMGDIAARYAPDASFLASITSAVQLGFIGGTLVFALFGIADRFSPVRVFFVSSLAAACCNLGAAMESISMDVLLLSRLLTGFFLAGIYPVGMKIASDHYQAKLGRSLGFLVGALVLGTAFPHLLKSFTLHLPWKSVVYATTALSILGGSLLLAFVKDGTHRTRTQTIRLTAFLSGFRIPTFRRAALGYFGHMWELYAFWAFLPVLLATYQHYHAISFNTSLLAFLVIGSGSIGCVSGGLLSQHYGPQKIATLALAVSGTCCLLSPLVLLYAPLPILFLFLWIWGMSVTADSPLFSTMVAQHAPVETRGSSLTIVNCLGFSITILSIQLWQQWAKSVEGAYAYILLAAGPVFGLLALTLQHTKKNGPASLT